jgi:hypothetical protein
VPVGQKHLCGGGNVFIKCVFFLAPVLSLQFSSFFAKKQNKCVFISAAYKKYL